MLNELIEDLMPVPIDKPLVRLGSLIDGKTLALLFDQNAGTAGTRVGFMGRECSCTTLPDIPHDKYKHKIIFVYTRLRGFGQSTIEV